MKSDLYSLERGIKREIENIKKENLSAKNKKLIFDFQRLCVLTNLSKQRTLGYMRGLKLIALEIGKDFDKVSKEDIQNYVHKLHKKNYQPITIISYKVILKKFYKWLKGDDVKYPKEVDWINTSIKRSDRHLPGEGDLITEQEVKKLIDVTEHPRNKAFIAVLYESGCRIGEMCSLAIKDVKFDEYGAVIHVNGKTGPRPIRLVSSIPFLSVWINNHPLKNDRNSILWICIGSRNHNKPIHYLGIQFLLKSAFEKAGIKKKFNPHLFRHSRATFMANHLTEFQMNQYFGWVQGSSMPSTYVHLSGKNVDNAILELNGIKTDKKETKESKLKPKKCPRCDTINSFNDKFCGKCACILDIKTAMEVDENIKERSMYDKGLDILMKDKIAYRTLVERAKALGVDKMLLGKLNS